MDGVITNTETLHFESWKKAFLKIGYVLTNETYKNNLQSRKREEGMKDVLADITTEEMSIVSKYKTIYYNELIQGDVDVFLDTLEVIQYLSNENYTLCVVSSSSKANEIIHKVGLESFFQLIVSGPGSKNIRNKPYPDLYLSVMDSLEKGSEDVLIIEDSISGVASALATNAKVIGLNRDQLSYKTHMNLTEVSKLSIALIKEILDT